MLPVQEVGSHPKYELGLWDPARHGPQGQRAELDSSDAFFTQLERVTGETGMASPLLSLASLPQG